MNSVTPATWRPPSATRDVQSVARDTRPALPQTIEGVFYRHFNPVKTGYGRLSEVLRSEWLGENKNVDQVFISSVQPGWISAWHAHADITDRLFVASGTVRIVLYDMRGGSPADAKMQEFLMTGPEPGLLTIPPRVWHGLKNIGQDIAHVVNAVDIAYCYENPDHWRLPPDTTEIPYRF
jgi:dTDP-4-dehydrorhamnose 3,5-epimerase